MADGTCECREGYGALVAGGPNDCCGVLCAGDCHGHGACNRTTGTCSCEPGWRGAACGVPDCPADCSAHGKCNATTLRCECEDGWGGDSCERRMCLNDCNGHGACVDGECRCLPGWIGRDCDRRQCPDQCNYRGRCAWGSLDAPKCVCDDGFSGAACEQRHCPNRCSLHGDCTENATCACDPGWTGPSCATSTCLDLLGCSGHGLCHAGRCYCTPPYHGEACESAGCPGGCSGRGRCNKGVCECDAGWEGYKCDARACPGTEWKPGELVRRTEQCHGHGTCPGSPKPGHNTTCPTESCPGISCVCDAGWGGVDCRTPLCVGGCGDHGHCFEGKCYCKPGFTGARCDKKSCGEFNRCSDRGACINYVCKCSPGWCGGECELKACPGGCGVAGCSGRGSCVDGTCQCMAGWEGAMCEVRKCDNDCYQRGTCDNGTCTCDVGYGGHDCGERLCPRGCSGHGTCMGNKLCRCAQGYTGADCGLRTCPAHCSGRGQCFNGTCYCAADFYGTRCQNSACPTSDAADTSGAVCSGHGACHNPSCACDDGWGGPDCSLRTCAGGCARGALCIDGACSCPNRDGAAADAGGACPADCASNCSGHGVCRPYARHPRFFEGRLGARSDKALEPAGAAPAHLALPPVADACYCEPGWGGSRCETRACPSDCTDKRRGLCVNGTCLCHRGFGGAACELGELAPPAPPGRAPCDCAVRCTLSCLGKCCDVFDKQGRDAAHSCQRRCATDCAVAECEAYGLIARWSFRALGPSSPPPPPPVPLDGPSSPPPLPPPPHAPEALPAADGSLPACAGVDPADVNRSLTHAVLSVSPLVVRAEPGAVLRVMVYNRSAAKESDWVGVYPASVADAWCDVPPGVRTSWEHVPLDAPVAEVHVPFRRPLRTGRHAALLLSASYARLAGPTYFSAVPAVDPEPSPVPELADKDNGPVAKERPPASAASAVPTPTPVAPEEQFDAGTSASLEAAFKSRRGKVGVVRQGSTYTVTFNTGAAPHAYGVMEAAGSSQRYAVFRNWVDNPTFEELVAQETVAAERELHGGSAGEQGHAPEARESAAATRSPAPGLTQGLVEASDFPRLSAR